MDINVLQNNAAALSAQLQWLAAVIDARIKIYLVEDVALQSIADVEMPDVDETKAFGRLVKQYEMNRLERLTLLMALVPHLQPQLLDVFFSKNAIYDRPFTEFGGMKSKNYAGFIPTGETVAFVLAGADIYERLQVQQLFSADHFFSKSNILKLTETAPGEPLLSGALQLSPEYLNLLTTGQVNKPGYISSFPAKRITTALNWEDLVLSPDVLADVREIQSWITHSHTLLTDMGLDKKIKPGYRSLFYGPPGTGKTLTATLLGKATGLDVYRVDLSLIVSKYIGETETNLAAVFDQAQNKNWILFFDEADSLFGKRTTIKNAADRYANQEVAYLLQRIEDFPGVVILSTNLRANVDETFSRRFQSITHFAMPGKAERKKLWQQAFTGNIKTEPLLTDKLDEIATKYQLTGGSIINVLRYAALMALTHGGAITHKDVIAGIKKELAKVKS